jgi:penicillin-binding protein-related factor A (putative recombinase)
MEKKPKTKVFRLRDAKDLYGLNKKKVATFGLPSDFIVVSAGQMFFAEVKSSQQARFSLDALTPSQKAACLIATSCGCDYRIYIHNIKTDTWYIMTGAQYQAYKTSVKSVKWEDLCLLTAW